MLGNTSVYILKNVSIVVHRSDVDYERIKNWITALNFATKKKQCFPEHMDDFCAICYVIIY